MMENAEFDVVAINDLTDAKMLAHLFKYDTTQGRFNGEIEVKEGAFVVNGERNQNFQRQRPCKLTLGRIRSRRCT